MRNEFGSHLDYLSDEICQMNTRIGCIAHRQSRLSGFTPSPTPKPTKESSSDGGDDDDDGASCSETDDKMTASQRFTLYHS